MSKPFQFKQFKIEQDRCAMKIGTDGVLLGAWTRVDQKPDSILDIGTGTGVIALMLAQRCYAELVDALELDENAYEQAVENFEQSPWGDRLFCYHAHLYEFATEIEDTYDLIVCNPPFFEGSVALQEEQTNSKARANARFEESMPFELLVASVNQLLNAEGVFSVIIPRIREEESIEIAAQANLYPHHITHVKGNPEVAPKRSLIEFSRKQTDLAQDELIIETARHQHTKKYIDLVEDFYLKM